MVFFPDNHMSENIVTGEKFVTCCITADNAVNMMKAAILNKWARLQSFDHILYLLQLVSYIHAIFTKLFCSYFNVYIAEKLHIPM